MKTFTDNAGRTWTVAVNVGSVKAVKDALGVNLVDDTITKGLMERLATDPILLADVLYVLCREQADAQKVSDADFGRALAGDAIDAATAALLEELVDFFPQSRRGLLRAVLEKFRKLDAMRIAAVQQRLDSGQVEREMETILAATTGSAGNLPESSEPTPQG